jgi:hypothetical protein
MNKTVMTLLAIIVICPGLSSSATAADKPGSISAEGLSWDREAITMQWRDAEAYCRKKGMRLPTRDELTALSKSANSALITPPGKYWASRLVVGSGDNGTWVDLPSGARGEEVVTAQHHTRCVSGRMKSTDPDFDQVTVITYYNMTRGDEEQLRVVDGKWKAFVRDEPVDLAVVDIENGYLEFEDPGTGGGGTIISAALFLNKDKEPMLAEHQATRSTASCPDNEYVLKTYLLRGSTMIVVDDVLPAIPLELFLAKGFVPKKGDMFKLPGSYLRIEYRLPQKGTTLEAFLYTSLLACSLENFSEGMTAREREAAREFLRNVRKEPVRLKWNKASGRFDLPADK